MTEDTTGPGEITFMQLADPQLGMFAEISERSPERFTAMRERMADIHGIDRVGVRPVRPISGFAPETNLFTEAIQMANQLRPAFVVVCGDIVYHWDSDPQADEARRIGRLLDDGIDLHWVAGNHDVGADENHTIPTADTLERYRTRFGPDNYAFQQGDTSFIVLNSSIMQAPQEVPDEWKSQLEFLGHELEEARRGGSAHIVLFTHIPLFVHDPEEDTPLFNRTAVPIERRRPILDLLRRYGADAVFAGHLHGNVYASDGPMQMVTSGPVGYPVSIDGSGFREVHVTPDSIDHSWCRLTYEAPFMDTSGG